MGGYARVLGDRVNDAVAKPCRLLPFNLREPSLHIDVNLCSRLAEHREISEQRVTPLTIVAESVEIRISDERLSLLFASRGFERDGRRAFWRRRTPELQQAIAILRRRGSVDVQWAVIVPEATPFLWGVDHRDGDIGYHAMAGTPASISHPAGAQSFAVARLADDAYATEVTASSVQDIEVMCRFLSRFDTRASVRGCLLETIHCSQLRFWL